VTSTTPNGGNALYPADVAVYAPGEKKPGYDQAEPGVGLYLGYGAGRGAPPSIDGRDRYALSRPFQPIIEVRGSLIASEVPTEAPRHPRMLNVVADRLGMIAAVRQRSGRISELSDLAEQASATDAHQGVLFSRAELLWNQVCDAYRLINAVFASTAREGHAGAGSTAGYVAPVRYRRPDR
jgi:hypothetical protein